MCIFCSHPALNQNAPSFTNSDVRTLSLFIGFKNVAQCSVIFLNLSGLFYQNPGDFCYAVTEEFPLSGNSVILSVGDDRILCWVLYIVKIRSVWFFPLYSTVASPPLHLKGKILYSGLLLHLPDYFSNWFLTR